eukprot:3150198-Lingulodinium_polyedra.AAC.1
MTSKDRPVFAIAPVVAVGATDPESFEHQQFSADSAKANNVWEAKRCRATAVLRRSGAYFETDLKNDV